MLDKYLVIGEVNIDNYTLFLRRQGYTAYVESNGEETYLFTDCIISSISFELVKENNQQMKHLTAFNKWYSELSEKPDIIRGERNGIVIVYWDVTYDETSYDAWEDCMGKLSSIQNSLWELNDNNPRMLYRMGQGRNRTHYSAIINIAD